MGLWQLRRQLRAQWTSPVQGRAVEARLVAVQVMVHRQVPADGSLARPLGRHPGVVWWVRPLARLLGPRLALR